MRFNTGVQVLPRGSPLQFAFAVRLRSPPSSLSVGEAAEKTRVSHASSSSFSIGLRRGGGGTGRESAPSENCYCNHIGASTIEYTEFILSRLKFEHPISMNTSSNDFDIMSFALESLISGHPRLCTLMSNTPQNGTWRTIPIITGRNMSIP